jgi:hypothetical protein
VSIVSKKIPVACLTTCSTSVTASANYDSHPYGITDHGKTRLKVHPLQLNLGQKRERARERERKRERERERERERDEV